MKPRVRYLVCLGVGFVVYRISVEFMAIVSALLVGLVVFGVTWAVTARRQPDR